MAFRRGHWQICLGLMCLFAAVFLSHKHGPLTVVCSKLLVLHQQYARDAWAGVPDAYTVFRWNRFLILVKHFTTEEQFPRSEIVRFQGQVSGHVTAVREAVADLGLLEQDLVYQPSPALKASGHSFTHPLQDCFLWLPGLSAKPFWLAQAFPFLKDLEYAHSMILEEFRQINFNGGVSAYNVPDLGSETQVSNWRTYHLVGQSGGFYHENIRRVPHTWAALKALGPRLVEENMIMFSAVTERSKLGKHYGWSNLFLRGQLTLINAEPSRNKICVGNQTARWIAGKTLVLDDSFLHWVENDSDYTRVVLFFDIWHPDISDEELPYVREAYAKMRASKWYRTRQAMEAEQEKNLRGKQLSL